MCTVHVYLCMVCVQFCVQYIYVCVHILKQECGNGFKDWLFQFSNSEWKPALTLHQTALVWGEADYTLSVSGRYAGMISWARLLVRH